MYFSFLYKFFHLYFLHIYLYECKYNYIEMYIYFIVPFQFTLFQYEINKSLIQYEFPFKVYFEIYN